MILKIMLKRNIQPPIDTSASVDYKSFVITPEQSVIDYINGIDNKGCGVSIDVAGIEILERTPPNE